jgi:type I restriction enzyme S subunit
MKWATYPDYKKSGVEWVGEVPSHWKIRQIKWGNPVRRGASPRPIDDPKYFDDNGHWSWVRIADVSASPGRLTETRQRLSELGSSLSVKLDPGNLFISIAGTVGKPCITDIPACIHDGFVYFPNLDIDPEYLFRIFESGECYQGLGKFGTQLNLNTDTVGSIRIPIPALAEQQAIVDFLKVETAKIDELISKQEQLITTLREDRTATITQAVTKGLKPNVGMNDSGVEWIGAIPTGWTATALKHLATVRDCKHLTAEFVEEGYPLASIREVQARYLDLSHAKRTTEHFYKLLIEGDRRPSPGDLIFSRNATVGEVAQVTDNLVDFAMGQDVCMIRPQSPKVESSFLWFTLRSQYVRRQLDMMMIGSTFKRINVEEIRSILVALPSETEQVTIVHFLEERCAKIDALIEKATQVVGTLREYRSALITAAVTGKIDVRGAA